MRGGIVAGGGLAHDLIAFIDGLGTAVRAAQRPEVLHEMVGEQKGMVRSAVGGGSADNLTLVIDAEGDTLADAAQGAEVAKDAVAGEESVNRAGGSQVGSDRRAWVIDRFRLGQGSAGRQVG